MRRLALLGSLLLAAPAWAHLPEPYGRDFVRAPQPGTGDQSALDATPSPSSEDLAAVEQQIEARRLQGGPYSPSLSDPLLQLATLQQRAGNPVAALRHYEQALHVLRVNNGLLHPVQLPLLRALADCYDTIGDDRSGQLARRYTLRVHGEPDAPLQGEVLDDALVYFQGARDAFIDPRGGRDRGLFMDAFDDNERLLEQQWASDDFASLQALAISHLYNLHLLLGIDAMGTAALGPDVETDRILRLQSLALGKGLELIDALLARLGPDPSRERAQLLLRRANWQQWNGRWRSARADYAAVAEALDASPWGVALSERLAAPAVLPEDPQLWQRLQEPGIPIRAVVRASFHVSPRGDVSRLAVEREDEGSSALAGQLRRLLADSHLRPALRGGVPVEADVHERRYLLID